MLPLDGFRPDPKPTIVGGIGRPKPKAATRASSQQWERLREQCLGPCIVCTSAGLEQRLESSLHHVVPRGQGGADVACNLAPVCGDGTTGHHGLLEAHDEETCQVFAAALRRQLPEVYRYALATLGVDRFARRYHVRIAA